MNYYIVSNNGSRKRVFLFPREEQKMFGFNKKKKTLELVSPINGKMIPIQDVPDKVFASEMMGPSVAFISVDGKVYSPCDGDLVTVFPTKHALGIKAQNGAELLLHFGIDTIQLEGKGFTLIKEAGQKIKKGDLLLEVDVPFLKDSGYKIEMPMILTNSDDFNVNVNVCSNVSANQEIVMLIDKK